MAQSATGQIIEGLWRFEALHPEWTEPEGGEDGWEQCVAWSAVAVAGGLVLIDPLVDDWDAVDRVIASEGGCTGVVRTCHWHQRSIAEAAARYDVNVWAKPFPDGCLTCPADHVITDRDELFDGLRVIDVERADEIALWLPKQRALVFGDAMIRTGGGRLKVCPESWTQPEGGPERLRHLLSALADLPVEHVLVSHGPLVLGNGLASLRRATG
jgi:glyoxylase-like metal-dependent hydrolase (beta-lactamase superfamily II)